jgi:hypothetical protein
MSKKQLIKFIYHLFNKYAPGTEPTVEQIERELKVFGKRNA